MTWDGTAIGRVVGRAGDRVFPSQGRPRRAGDVHARHAAGPRGDEADPVIQIAEGRSQIAGWFGASERSEHIVQRLFAVLPAVFASAPTAQDDELAGAHFAICDLRSAICDLARSTIRQYPRDDVVLSFLPGGAKPELTTPAEEIVAQQQQQEWGIEDAIALYMIDRWGAGFFDINAHGDMTVSPAAGAGHPRAHHRRPARSPGSQSGRSSADPLPGPPPPPRGDPQRGLQPRHRREQATAAPTAASSPSRSTSSARSSRRSSTPARPFNYGLEVGSKPEMFAGLGRAQRQRVAHRLQRLQGRRLHPHRPARPQAGQEGHHRRREALRGARHRPHLHGDRRQADDRPPRQARSRRARASGPTSGRRERQVRPLHRGDPLRHRDPPARPSMQLAFKLLHFHIGSQVPDILTIKRAVREAARYYAKLAQDGPPHGVPRRRRRPRPSTTTARAPTSSPR